jgi:hypothetical protein
MEHAMAMAAVRLQKQIKVIRLHTTPDAPLALRERH